MIPSLEYQGLVDNGEPPMDQEQRSDMMKGSGKMKLAPVDRTET